MLIILLKINNLGNGYINININVTYIREHSYFCELRVLLYIMAKLLKIFFFLIVVQHTLYQMLRRYRFLFFYSFLKRSFK